MSFYGSWEISTEQDVAALTTGGGVCQLAVAGPDDGAAGGAAEEGGEGDHQWASRREFTVESVQEKSKQGVAFRQTSAATTYALACQCFAPDVFIGRCCKDLTQLALALVAAFFNFVRTTLQVSLAAPPHPQGLSLPTMEGITASATAQPATPTTPTTPVAINDATTAFLVDLLHVRVATGREA